MADSAVFECELSKETLLFSILVLLLDLRVTIPIVDCPLASFTVQIRSKT